MPALFSREVILDTDDIREDIVFMSPHQSAAFLRAVVEGVFGARTVHEAASSHEAIQGARDALSQCGIDTAKGLRIIAGILSEKFDLAEEGLGSGEGE